MEKFNDEVREKNSYDCNIVKIPTQEATTLLNGSEVNRGVSQAEAQSPTNINKLLKKRNRQQKQQTLSSACNSPMFALLKGQTEEPLTTTSNTKYLKNRPTDLNLTQKNRRRLNNSVEAAAKDRENKDLNSALQEDKHSEQVFETKNKSEPSSREQSKSVIRGVIDATVQAASSCVSSAEESNMIV